MRKAKPTAAPGTLPSNAILRQWFLLPLAPTRREANAGVPIVLPVGGKRVLAQIVWSNDDSHQARFVKAGRRNPYGLSREEYLQLAGTDSFWMNDEMAHDLLTAWAIRAAKRDPRLSKERERLLQFSFTEQLVDFLLGRPDNRPALDVYRGRIAGTGEPEEIVRRYLVSENWKHTVELLALQDQLTAPRRKGGWSTKKKYSMQPQVRSAAERVLRENPSLGNRGAFIRLVQGELGKNQAGKEKTSPSTIKRHARDLLPKSKAKP